MNLNIRKEYFFERGGLLDRVLDSSFDQALIVDKDKRIIFFSESSRRFTGIEPINVVGKNIDEVVPNTGFEIVMKTGESDKGILTRLDGNLGIASHIPVFDGKELLGAIGIVYFNNLASLKKIMAEMPSENSAVDLYHSISRQVSTYTFKDYIGETNIVKALIEQTKRAASSNLPILLIGETGTGKEILANAIHHHNKATFSNPFIKINCSAIPNELLESELFGYEKGAFTGAASTKKGKFELANNGSILLDEIGEMGFDMQTKLLRVLEEREFERIGGNRLIPTNARVIASTNADLKRLSFQKKFRSDLYYRLNTLEIEVPPLRERLSDLSILIEYFTKKNHLDVVFSQSAMDLMMTYHWPGNVRQLRNLINRFSVLNRGVVVEADDIEKILHQERNYDNREVEPDGKRLDIKMDSVENMERQLIVKVLRQTEGNKTKAAEVLSLSRSTLLRKIKKYQI